MSDLYITRARIPIHLAFVVFRPQQHQNHGGGGGGGNPTPPPLLQLLGVDCGPSDCPVDERLELSMDFSLDRPLRSASWEVKVRGPVLSRLVPLILFPIAPPAVERYSYSTVMLDAPHKPSQHPLQEPQKCFSRKSHGRSMKYDHVEQAQNIWVHYAYLQILLFLTGTLVRLASHTTE